MITVSLCMIVKNEEAVLARCLDSLKNLMDEIIIVDTGSTDRTKEIAMQYTDKIYDFKWVDDFSEARNFSFSKASMDYIYAPDADEVLDQENQKRFRILKEAMLPEIEIVQMKYITPDEYNTVENSSYDMRPKLFKRLREFTWINPIHETVRLDPVVFDSDIEILHLPQSLHGKRDFGIFQKALKKDGGLSPSLTTMYAKELLKCGNAEDFAAASPFFKEKYMNEPSEEASCVLARHYHLCGETDSFFAVSLKSVAQNSCSEICCELGSYYFEKGDYQEAELWFYNAAFETAPVLDVSAGGIIPLQGLADCHEKLGNTELAAEYRGMADKWTLPDNTLTDNMSCK